MSYFRNMPELLLDIETGTQVVGNFPGMTFALGLPDGKK